MKCDHPVMCELTPVNSQKILIIVFFTFFYDPILSYKGAMVILRLAIFMYKYVIYICPIDTRTEQLMTLQYTYNFCD